MDKDCKYLYYRRCLIKDLMTNEPFATPQFCEINCKPNNETKQREMLRNVYGIEVDEMPSPDSLREQYKQQEKNCPKRKPKPRRTKEQQAYLIQYCGQVCGKLHDKKPSCGVTKCKIKGSFVCPEGKWNELNIIHTAIPTQETEPLELKD